LKAYQKLEFCIQVFILGNIGISLKRISLINKTSGLLEMFLTTQSWRIPKSEELFNWLTFGKWAL
jgi:hypothetical protein